MVFGGVFFDFLVPESRSGFVAPVSPSSEEEDDGADAEGDEENAGY